MIGWRCLRPTASGRAGYLAHPGGIMARVEARKRVHRHLIRAPTGHGFVECSSNPDLDPVRVGRLWSQLAPCRPRTTSQASPWMVSDIGGSWSSRTAVVRTQHMPSRLTARSDIVDA